MKESKAVSHAKSHGRVALTSSSASSSTPAKSVRKGVPKLLVVELCVALWVCWTYFQSMLLLDDSSVSNPSKNVSDEDDGSGDTEAPIATCWNEGDGVDFPLFPHLIILGDEYSGSKELYRMLQSIPKFLATTGGNETHFWDEVIRPRVGPDLYEGCDLYSQYYSQWGRPKEDTKIRIMGELAPDTLAYPWLAKTVRSFLDHLMTDHPVKIVVLLRDPIDRLFAQFHSEYRRNQEEGGEPLRLDGIVRKEVVVLRKGGVIRAPSFRGQISNAEMSREWDPDKFFKLDEELEGYTSILQRGLYASQVAAFKRHFPNGKSLLALRYEDFRFNPAATVRQVWKFVTNKDLMVDRNDPIFSFHQSGNVTDKGNVTAVPVPPMSRSTRTYLQRLHRPFNDRLIDILGDSWRGVWDED